MTRQRVETVSLDLIEDLASFGREDAYGRFGSFKTYHVTRSSKRRLLRALAFKKVLLYGDYLSFSF